MREDIAEAVLAREEVVKYGQRGTDARERISHYLDELRTTQRYPFYRALQHPLYPILRKIERLHENLHHVVSATFRHRIVYASNHKSHTDYLVEPLVLTTTRSVRRSSLPASTCSVARSASCTGTSPARFRFGATRRIRRTS
jgi:glycerol-3-phosphate O-acyltransferase